MLIRSQDRELLVGYESGIWQADKCKVCWLSLSNGNYWFEFGEFDSHEKALMVLDRMQEFYHDYCTQKSISEISGKYGFTYQIPSDEEINVSTVKDIINDIVNM